MKTQFKILFSAAIFLLAGTMAMAQSDAEEVPGDNFSLEGALELFKKSASPQEFEQLLNSPDSKVNNLDLNGDGNIDYIRVIDKNDGNVHAFILQAVVSQNESQDVAVIELEKKNDGDAVLQIVGDKDIYGIETIIEPTEQVKVNAGTSTARTIVNVWAWPSVQYVYGPAYTVWVSPWGWSYYPGWYRPWRPIAWRYYDPYWAPYRPYYSVAFRHRIWYANRIYRPYRTTSVIVYNTHHSQINNFRTTSNGYRYDRGDYARGSRGNYNSRTSYNNRSRSSYSNNSGYRNSNGNTRTYSNHQRSAYNGSRGTSSPSTSRSQAPVQRQSRTPVQRQAQPQFRSAPQQHQRTIPQQHQRSIPQPHQRSMPSGGGSHGGGGGAAHGRRH